MTLNFPASVPGGKDVAISGENIFQALPWPEVRKFLSRVEHSDDSQQMTFFADAVAGGRLELLRIDDRARSRITEVLFSRAVTTFTRDRFRREWRRAILVRGTGNV